MVAGAFPHARHGEKAAEETPDARLEGNARVMDRYYEMLDQFVGQIRSALTPDDYVLIVSPYGFEPMGPAGRLARIVAEIPDFGGEHDAAPAGILLLTGKGVLPGKQLDDLKITDVVPLTLYFLGLPLGRDLDGRLPKRIFDRAFLDAFPITVIPTYG
jgi:predicted AlkP superfamily phosphohydrolase/phosphomutase